MKALVSIRCAVRCKMDVLNILEDGCKEKCWWPVVCWHRSLSIVAGLSIPRQPGGNNVRFFHRQSLPKFYLLHLFSSLLRFSFRGLCLSTEISNRNFNQGLEFVQCYVTSPPKEGVLRIFSPFKNPDCSPAHIFTQKARRHTKYYAAASPHWLLYF